MRCDILTLFPDMVAAGAGPEYPQAGPGEGPAGGPCRKICGTIPTAGTRWRTMRLWRGSGDGHEGRAGLARRRCIGRGTGPGETTLRLICRLRRGGRSPRTWRRNLRQEPRRGVVCGHYEGIDERVRLGLEPEEISVGDYVLTGGELPAFVMIDAAARLIPGVLGDAGSRRTAESFAETLLDYPHYTRPAGVARDGGSGGVAIGQS